MFSWATFAPLREGALQAWNRVVTEAPRVAANTRRALDEARIVLVKFRTTFFFFFFFYP